MSKKLNYIHLEDEQSIVSLTKRLLEKEGYTIECRAVQTRDEFLDALSEADMDLVIADYAMPGFDGLSALDLLRKRDKELPFILFSGSIGEKKAIDSLKRGATDYVLKQNVRALVPAIGRALKEAEYKLEQIKAQQELQQSKENLDLILDNLQTCVLLIDKETHEIIDINPKAAELFGKKPAEIIGHTCNTVICPHAIGNCPISDLGQEIDNSERIMITPEGEEIPVLKSVVQIMINNRPHLLESFLDIRQQKMMESEVTSFGRILDNALNEIYIFDAETLKFIKLNRGAKENIGYDEEEYYHLTPVDIKPEFTIESFERFIQPLRKGEQEKLNFATVHKRKDGSTYPVEVFLQMTEFENKAAFVAIISDISERVRSEKIRQTMFEIAAASIKAKNEFEYYVLIQQKLSTLLDTSNFIIAKYDDQKDTLTVAYMADMKDRIEQFDAFPAKNTVSAYVIKSRKSLLLNEDQVGEFFQKHKISWVGTPAKCWLGVPLILDDQAIGLMIVQNYEHSGVFDKQDQNLLEFVAGQLAESIKRKQIESRIFQLFRSVEQSPVSTVITDLKGNIQYVNPKFCQVTGYSYEEAIGQNPRILKSGETAPEEYKELWDTISGGKVWRGRFHNKKKNGELFWEDATIGPIKNETGRTTHYLAIKEDITERVEAERRLNRLNRQNEILLASFPSILMVMNKDEKVIRWNKMAEQVFGLGWQDVRGKHLLELALPWNGEKVNEGITASRKNGQILQLADISFKKQGGINGFLNITIAPIISDENIIDGYLIHAEDITEKKIAQGQQAQAQKLESIGQLAAGIAHEINTPAQYVGDNTHFLQDSFNDLKKLLNIFAQMQEAQKSNGDGSALIDETKRVAEEIDLEFLIDEIPVAIEQSLDGISKVSKIVRAMKEFSHPGGKGKTLVDLNRAIENTITVSRNEWKYVADMETDFDESLTAVPCFPDEFNQVILNLIINAAHAIDSKLKDAQSKGTIVIKTRKVDDTAEITVKDDGPGIAREIQKKIFDPFFTTKEVGKGTGQGLAIAYDVIHNKHSGSIGVESTPGEGASFIIQLPLDTL